VQGYQGENGDLKNRRGLDVRFNHMDFPMGDMDKNESTYADSSIGEGMDITIQVRNFWPTFNLAKNFRFLLIHYKHESRQAAVIC
jgi:hypothetical protein